ncbi:MAG: hypothetical protein WCL14_05420 [Bacteroidota bacterium]
MRIKMKIAEIVPFSRAVMAMFDAYRDSIIDYDDRLADPFETDTWEVQIAAADAIIGTAGSILLNASKTKKMLGYMRSVRPILKNLKFKIEKCIALGTITDSLESFNIGDLLISITNKNVGEFHGCYTALYAKIIETDIAAALDDVGFGADAILSLKTQHDLAWDISDSKIILKSNIHLVSEGNQVVMNTLLDTDQMVVDAMQALAQTNGDLDWIKRATSVAILKTVRATPTKKIRKRKVKKTGFIRFQTDFVAKDTIQGKVTSKESLYMVQSNSLEGPYSGGLELKPDEEFNLKKRMIPGVGKYIIVYNPSNHVNGVFEVLLIKG